MNEWRGGLGGEVEGGECLRYRMRHRNRWADIWTQVGTLGGGFFFFFFFFGGGGGKQRGG